MELEKDSSSHKSRKRDRSSIEDCNGDVASEPQDGRGAPPKRRPRNAAAVGSYVIKTFPGEVVTFGPGYLLGKVLSYGCGLYTTVFDDGSREALHIQELRQMLMGQQELVQGDTDELFRTKKTNLEQLISSEGSDAATVVASARTRSRKSSSAVTMPENASTATMPENASVDKNLDSVDVSSLNINSAVVDDEDEDKDDADSCTDSSCDSLPTLDSNMTLEAPCPIPELILPPSSSDIGVPEESVPLLFSVYSFLRSFSHQLFLSPFGFDDFVGSLNCTTQNTLFDAINVALMRALMRHSEALASEGSKIANKSLKLVKWNLLDTLTWPVILLQYFFVMGHMKQMDLKRFLAGAMSSEYHSLSVTTKLKVLQILCDDTVEALEIRSELAMRESMDEERDDDFYPNTLYPESGPKRVHPRYSKTSACKDVKSIEHAVTVEQANSMKVTGKDAGGLDAELDGNSDDCRLCGMDGTLICCDGCPSAYHSRCIGLNKASLPEGQWFCPECIVKRMGPTSSRISLGIKGAEHFGVDPSGRMFLGVCNYLLVLEDFSPTIISRYYNHKDVIKVFQLLCSAQVASPRYASICQAISTYWEISFTGDLQLNKLDAPVTSVESQTLKAIGYSPPSVFPYTSVGHNPVGSAKVSGQDISFSKNSESSFLTNRKGPYLYEQDKKIDLFNTGTKYIGDLNGLKTEQLAIEVLRSPQLVNDSTLSLDTPGLPTDNSSTNHPDPARTIALPHSELFCSKFMDESSREDASSISSQTKIHSLSRPNEYSLESSTDNGKNIAKSTIFSHSGAFFKPQAYMNQYIHGEVAASAAAKLATLSEEAKMSQSHVSLSQRKILAFNIALQVKAFSGLCLHFQWPSTDKKSSDVPRERCGWCIACKGAATCKKGCMLNSAVSNAIKLSSRCTKALKNDGRTISAIAAYILHVEENLHDLMDGPLADAKYNIQWRKAVKEASTCAALKYLLLELEENIREVAFSSGWMKPVDEWAVELPGVVKGESFTGTSQRRCFAGRRGRKPSAISDINQSDGDDDAEKFQWWRGGKCLRDIFHFGELPKSLAKKIARQGGVRVVSGILYSSLHKSPFRTRRLSWRAAVEASKNASLLAFQVRYLDTYLKWKELVRPEQILSDGKTADIEASTFRKASIYDKKVADDKICYAVKFVNQKHLPSRVKKNILEVEHCSDNSEKLWFTECYVPLYMIKEYEGRKDDAGLTAAVNKVKSVSLPKFQTRHRKAICKNIFSYLYDKKHATKSCASCKQDVLLRDSDRCKNCQGHTHKHCLSKGTLCNPCYSEAVLRETRETNLSISKDLVQPDAKSKTDNVVNRFNLISSDEPLVEANITPSSSVTVKKKKHVTYGLIWKRKGPNESNADFHRDYLILKGDVGQESLVKPVCKLCSKPYNRELMYIRCENCSNWYHADSLLLKEEQLPELVGFKCCKCRRVKIPKCPYADPDLKKSEIRSEHKNLGSQSMSTQLVSRNKNLVSQSHMSSQLVLGHMNLVGQSSMSAQLVSGHRNLVSQSSLSPHLVSGHKNLVSQSSISPQLVSTPVHDQIKDEEIDFPLEQVDNDEQTADEDNLQNNELKMVSVPFSQKKLPVRRLANRGMQVDGTTGDAADNVDSACSTLAEKGFSTIQEADCAKRIESMESPMAFTSDDDSRELRTMDIKEDLLGSEGVAPDDMQYEPQTYFSFTELLSTGDGDAEDLYDDQIPLALSDEWCQISGYDVEEDDNALQDALSCDIGPTDEFVTANEASPDGAGCGRCKQNKPPPDLICGICGFVIHYLCSPWDEREVHENGTWRCGYCRDWR